MTDMQARSFQSLLKATLFLLCVILCTNIYTMTNMPKDREPESLMKIGKVLPDGTTVEVKRARGESLDHWKARILEGLSVIK